MCPLCLHLWHDASFFNYLCRHSSMRMYVYTAGIDSLRLWWSFRGITAGLCVIFAWKGRWVSPVKCAHSILEGICTVCRKLSDFIHWLSSMSHIAIRFGNRNTCPSNRKFCLEKQILKLRFILYNRAVLPELEHSRSKVIFKVSRFSTLT